MCSGSLEQTASRSRLSPPNSVALRRCGDPFRNFPYNGGIEWIQKGRPMTTNTLAARASFLPRWFFVLAPFGPARGSGHVNPPKLKPCLLEARALPMSMRSRDAALTRRSHQRAIYRSTGVPAVANILPKRRNLSSWTRIRGRRGSGFVIDPRATF